MVAYNSNYVQMQCQYIWVYYHVYHFFGIIINVYHH